MRFTYSMLWKYAKKFKESITRILLFLGVSRSGYYRWLPNLITTHSYNKDLIEIIQEGFDLEDGIWGTERIWASLRKIQINSKCQDN